MSELEKSIQERIRLGDGWIPFEEFMRMALHEPGLGYYASGRNPIGADGDFTTAARESDLYARTFARCVHKSMPEGGRALEIGGGSGSFISSLAVEMDSMGTKVDLLALEPSPSLHESQRFEIKKAGLTGRCEWITELPEKFTGVIIANEVLDALPCSVYAQRGGQWIERGIALGDDGLFEWADGPPASDDVVSRVADLELPEGYQLEINHQAEALASTLTSTLEKGVILITDYGFPRKELYHAQRTQGTLSSHRSHHVEPDVLANPGEQDITSHVDFSGIARAAASAGGSIAGFTAQAAFLLELGISTIAEESEDLADRARTSHELQTLLMPHEMGEMFKVLAVSKGMDKSPPGFSIGDRLNSL